MQLKKHTKPKQFWKKKSNKRQQKLTVYKRPELETDPEISFSKQTPHVITPCNIGESSSIETHWYAETQKHSTDC